MRVITGTARGCRLETPAGQATRPTAERVKEGLFSAIQFEIEGRRALDLFAGSGQLGIEALSRGAASCVFVEQNGQAAELVRRNLQAAKLFSSAQVLTTEALGFLARCREQFDLVFLDPPYGDALLASCLAAVEPHIADGGLVVCESDEGQALPETVGALQADRTYRYGRVHITLYRRKV